MSLVLAHQTNNLAEERIELEEQRSQLETIIGEAQGQLDEAKARQRLTGEYADADWFIKTKALIRDETVKLHGINRRIKDIKSQMSRANPKAAYFQEAAKKVLDSDTYNKINSIANEWMRT
jgi:hypothetical protein